jgi:hypothetical protein
VEKMGVSEPPAGEPLPGALGKVYCRRSAHTLSTAHVSGVGVARVWR